MKDLDEQRQNPAVFDLADIKDGHPVARPVKIFVIFVVDSTQELEKYKKLHDMNLKNSHEWIGYMLCEDATISPKLSIGMKRDYVKLCSEKLRLQR